MKEMRKERKGKEKKGKERKKKKIQKTNKKYTKTYLLLERVVTINKLASKSVALATQWSALKKLLDLVVKTNLVNLIWICPFSGKKKQLPLVT